MVCVPFSVQRLKRALKRERFGSRTRNHTAPYTYLYELWLRWTCYSMRVAMEKQHAACKSKRMRNGKMNKPCEKLKKSDERIKRWEHGKWKGEMFNETKRIEMIKIIIRLICCFFFWIIMLNRTKIYFIIMMQQ